MNCYTGDHTAGDRIHTDITTCSTEESQKKYRIGIVSYRLLDGGGLKILHFVYCIFIISFHNLSTDIAASDSLAPIFFLRNYK